MIGMEDIFDLLAEEQLKKQMRGSQFDSEGFPSLLSIGPRTIAEADQIIQDRESPGGLLKYAQNLASSFGEPEEQEFLEEDPWDIEGYRQSPEFGNYMNQYGAATGQPVRVPETSGLLDQANGTAFKKTTESLLPTPQTSQATNFVDEQETGNGTVGTGSGKDPRPLRESPFNQMMQRFGGTGQKIAQGISPLTNILGGMGELWRGQAERGALGALAPTYQAGIQKQMNDAMNRQLQQAQIKELGMEDPYEPQTRYRALNPDEMARFGIAEGTPVRGEYTVDKYNNEIANSLKPVRIGGAGTVFNYGPGAGDLSPVQQMILEPVAEEWTEVRTNVPRIGATVTMLDALGGQGKTADGQNVAEELSRLNRLKHTQVGGLTPPQQAQFDSLRVSLVNSTEGMITGSFKEVRTGLGNFFALIAKGGKEQTNFNEAKSLVDEIYARVSNTQVFDAESGILVGAIIKAFGSGTGLSDKDLEFARNISGAIKNGTADAILRVVLNRQWEMLSEINASNAQVEDTAHFVPEAERRIMTIDAHRDEYPYLFRGT